jgi:hypothetical protein
MKIFDFLQNKISFWNEKSTLQAVCAGLRCGGKRTFKANFAQPGRFCAVF